MSRRRLWTIGVLGGMGPEAGAYLFERIVRSVAAGRDQDHPPVVVCSLPQVPDRTEAILRGGPSPVPLLLRGLETLRRAGADFAVVACVTAHHFLPRLAARSPLPLVDLLGETVAEVARSRPVPRTIGLLATTGTVRSGLVADAFAPAGIRVIVPAARDQRRLMTAIYGRKGVKAGHTSGAARETVLSVARGLVRRGAGAVLAGCTEVPLVLGASDLAVPLIEPMEIGARAAVRRSGASLRPGARR